MNHWFTGTETKMPLLETPQPAIWEKVGLETFGGENHIQKLSSCWGISFAFMQIPIKLTLIPFVVPNLNGGTCSPTPGAKESKCKTNKRVSILAPGTTELGCHTPLLNQLKSDEELKSKSMFVTATPESFTKINFMMEFEPAWVDGIVKRLVISDRFG